MNIDQKQNHMQIIKAIGNVPMLVALLLIARPASAQIALPPDARQTCAVAPNDFKAWFAGNSITKDGIVLPADSLAFSADPKELCPFFKWSTQMFLWLTSPLGSGHVFGSKQFYEVLPPQGGTRTLRVPEAPGQFLSFAPSITQRGSRGQEVVFDSTGKIHDVVRPEGGRLALLNTANQLAEVGQIQSAPDGKPQLLDRSGKSIEARAASNGAPLLVGVAGQLRDRSGAPIDLAPTTVSVNGKPALLTTSGAVVGTEQGQADDSVLIAQNKSIVYYLIQVNDVFAYFRTGAKDGKFNPAPAAFPAAQDLLDKITTVAQQAPAPHTKQQFPDAKALTMEIKSSWVETSNLTNAGDYITINTNIPEFTRSADQKTLTPTGNSKPAQLALIGMHVVGSTNQHPEMIWASFEHVNNAPNRQYSYLNASGPTTKQADGPGTWLLSAAGAGSSGPDANATLGPQGTIVSTDGNPIGPVNVTRVNPWGSDPGGADTNTAVVSINKSIIDQLAAGDVRRNYVMIGSIWTDGKPPGDTNILGTTGLANATMETFEQPGACFDCHRGNMLGTNGGGLSHIWAEINPLFP